MIKVIFLNQRLFFAADEEKGRQKKGCGGAAAYGKPKY